jgi:polysaccharide deacetylase 2 family uncharacterized protein YibQ
MARKKKKRTRSFSGAPLLLLAIVIGAAVAWAIWPRPVRRHHPRTVAVASPSQQAETRTAATAEPSAQATVAPGASPQSSPAAVSSPAASPAASPPVTSTNPPSGVQIALIIDDCGQWLGTERSLIALPIPITLSVLPHVHYSQTIAQEAADAGKGVMLHVPMEPLSHMYPGPGEIKTAMTDDAIAKQMEDDVAQVPLAKGMNNHEGSEATADTRVMKDVIAIAKEHGLFFIDSRTNAQTVGAAQATDAGVPTASRDVFLDDKADVAYTESMLERAVKIARENGSAIAIGHPKPTTLAAIRDMYPKMEAEGIRFVLASSLVH